MPRTKTPAPERFWQKVVKGSDDDCWEWQACKNQDGYGLFFGYKGAISAHRFSYELHVDEVGQGLHVDHLCFNPGCVNPAHLEVVTPEENNNRIRIRTHCVNGHEFTEENTIWMNRKGRNPSRACRTCNNKKCKERYARSKDASVDK